jgi:hypothetical protein
MTPCQVVDFTFDNGVVELYIGEAVVNSIRLTFKDAKTGDPKEVGATRPEVITRHLTTREGQVRVVVQGGNLCMREAPASGQSSVCCP